MKRSAHAQWRGDLKSGAGTVSADSGILHEAPYSFVTRFENGKGTNPEELLAAAHAGCFSMALSMVLQQAGFTAELIDTRCTISLEKRDDGFAIVASHLVLNAKVPGASQEQFLEAANTAKQNCPVSKLYKADITLEATLAS